MYSQINFVAAHSIRIWLGKVKHGVTRKRRRQRRKEFEKSVYNLFKDERCLPVNKSKEKNSRA